MAAATGYGYAIQQFKKIKVQSLQQALCIALFGCELPPLAKGTLRLLKDIFYGFLCTKFAIDELCIAFIG